MKRQFILFSLFAYILFSFYCSAAEKQFTSYGQTLYFQRYLMLRKNDPVMVNTVFHDKAGFMWFGTNKGLFRFDGINQKRYRTSDGLPDENVTAIAEDSEGRIWI